MFANIPPYNSHFNTSCDSSFGLYEEDPAYMSFCSDYTELGFPGGHLPVEKPPMLPLPQQQTLQDGHSLQAPPIHHDYVVYPPSPESTSPSTSYDYSIPSSSTIPAHVGVPAHLSFDCYLPASVGMDMGPVMPYPDAAAAAGATAPSSGHHTNVGAAPCATSATPVSTPTLPREAAAGRTLVAAPLTPVTSDSHSKGKTPEQLAVKISSMGFHHSFPAVRKFNERSLSLHMPLMPLDEQRKNYIMQAAIEKGLNPEVVKSHVEMFPNDDWANQVPHELRVLPVVAVDIGGSSVDSKSKHVKRPLNSFMIYRKAQTQRARYNALHSDQKINHQTISSIVGLLWQTEGSQVHDQFSDAASVEKYLHSAQHPNYKFKPRKKTRAPKEQVDSESESG